MDMKRILSVLCAGSLLFTPPQLAGTGQEILGNPGSGEVEVSAGGTAVGEAGQQYGNESSGKGQEEGAPEREGDAAGMAAETEAPAEGTAAGPEVAAPSAVLMEASTGKVIYEKDADKQRRPASITKIMTLILIFDAIDAGKIKMTDEVVTSAYAKSMGIPGLSGGRGNTVCRDHDQMHRGGVGK